MQDTLKVLRSLQQLDRTLYQVRDEIQRLPEERRKRQEKLDLQRQEVVDLDRKIHELRLRIKEIEDLTTMQRQRQRKLEGEAAGSKADTALLVAYQHEIKTLKRGISEAEEEGLGLVDEQKELQDRRVALQAAVSAAEKDFEEFSANVERELKAAEKRASGLDQERRKRMGDELSAEVVLQYEKLLEAREGQAIAELDGRVCQGCNVAVPNNIYVRLARGVELVLCPSCGRILYLAN